jgi:hypothetical protein
MSSCELKAWNSLAGRTQLLSRVSTRHRTRHQPA